MTETSTTAARRASTGSRRRRAPRGHGHELRDRILDEAERLLVRKGSMDAVSLRSIATACDCTPPALYLHFADKDELFFEVCNRRFEEFAAQIAGAIVGVDDPAERLARMGYAYATYGFEHPEHYKILFADKVLPDREIEADELAGMRAYEALLGTIQDGVGAGVFVDRDPVTLALGIWATMHGYVLLATVYPDDIAELHGAADAAGRVEDVLAMALRAVLADPGRADEVLAAARP